jgi:predicted nucleic acid-binding protein
MQQEPIHPLREASKQVLQRVVERELEAIINTEILQEILFVLNRRGLRERGLDLARSAALSRGNHTPSAQGMSLIQTAA